MNEECDLHVLPARALISRLVFFLFFFCVCVCLCCVCWFRTGPHLMSSDSTCRNPFGPAGAARITRYRDGMARAVRGQLRRSLRGGAEVDRGE